MLSDLNEIWFTYGSKRYLSKSEIIISIIQGGTLENLTKLINIFTHLTYMTSDISFNLVKKLILSSAVQALVYSCSSPRNSLINKVDNDS